MDSRTIGFVIAGAGLLLLAIGLLVAYGGLDWFGRLPGDLRIERGNTRIYIPLASMILVSVLLTVLVHLFSRFL